MSTAASYAAAVIDNAMSPRLFKNESVIFEKDEEVWIDGDVFIELSSGDYLIRELVAMDERKITVHTYAPDVTVEIPRTAIAGIFPITKRCFCTLDNLLAQLGFPEVRHG